MASAAAVSADSERPNLPHALNDNAAIAGIITSVDNDEDEEEVIGGAKKKTNVDRELFDHSTDQTPAEENEDDLFGEEEDVEEQLKYVRVKA